MVQYFASKSSFTLADGTTTVAVGVQTGYPFEETVSFTIDASAAFEFSMRIPAWCASKTSQRPLSVSLSSRPYVSAIASGAHSWWVQLLLRRNDSAALNLLRCEGATATAGAETTADLARLSPGAMHSMPLSAGKSTVTLTLPLKIRVARRPPYLLDATTAIDTNAANIYRGRKSTDIPGGSP